MTTQETLDTIKPGKNYPTSVSIVEDGRNITFNLCSYFVGMYCAATVDGKHAAQMGDHNNKTFMTKFKRDILKAIRRGAIVEIGSILPCKLS